MPKQIEHWAKIGRLVEENPDLSYATIREMQQASTEVQAGLVSRYERQTARTSEVVDPEHQAMLQLLASAEEDVAAGRVISSSELLARLSARAAAHR